MSFPKLALGSWAFTFGPCKEAPWSFPLVLAYAKRAGYDGIEINGFKPHPHPDEYNTPAKCRKLHAEISAYALGISGYAPDFSKWPPAIVRTEDYLGVLRPALAFCKACGIGLLRVDTGSPPIELERREYRKQFEQLVRTWRLSAEESAQYDVLLVWEFEPGFWLNKPSEVQRVVETIQHSNFKLLFDTSHAYMGAVVGARQTGRKELLAGGVAEYADSVKDFIGHLHLINSDGTLHDNETSTHAAFDRGHIDFVDVLKKIKRIVQHLEWWCVDLCFNPDAERIGRAAVPFMHDVMKQIVQNNERTV